MSEISSNEVHDYVEMHSLSLAGFIACHIYSVLKRAFPHYSENDPKSTLRHVFEQQHHSLWACCMDVNQSAIEDDDAELEDLYTLATTHHQFFKLVAAQRTVEKQIAKEIMEHDRNLH